MDGSFASDTARILVVGDSGVGKTSLVYLLTHKAVLATPAFSIGCAVSVVEIRQPNMNGSSFIEFWDIAGHQRYAESRRLFYQRPNGILCVFDLGNKISLANLEHWLGEIEEVMSIGEETVAERKANHHSYLSQLGGVPILFVGNKVDNVRMPSASEDSVILSWVVYFLGLFSPFGWKSRFDYQKVDVTEASAGSGCVDSDRFQEFYQKAFAHKQCQWA